MIDDFKSMTATELIKWLITYGESYTRNKRKCAEYEDDEMFYTNARRVMLKGDSGRDFIQMILDGDLKDLPQVKRTAYFDALNSSRRLNYVKDVSKAVLRFLDNYLIEKENIDYLSDIAELKGRYVCSGDGHSTTHAVHDAKIKDKYACTTIIYGQNLRTGLIDPIEIVIDPESSKPSEIKFLKKALPAYEKDRNIVNPLLVYDRAAIDNQFWTIADHPWSIVTRLKTNIKPTFKQPLEYDEMDTMNEGVTGYYMIGLNNAGTMYQIDYRDPETGEEYSFLTNDSTLRPGVVAFLYRIRWRIEKAFDVLKNKLFERKAWATTKESKEQQACITAFTYNLLVFIECVIKRDSQATLKVEEKRTYQLKVRQKKAEAEGRKVPWFEFKIDHVYQISQQFIRCFRSWIPAQTTLGERLNLFIERLNVYI